MSENVGPLAQPVAGQPAVRPVTRGWHPASIIQAPLPGRLVLALLSGLSVWPVMGLIDWAPWNLLLAGGIFGALVLVPFLEARQARLLRAFGLVAGGGLIHWGALELAAFLGLHSDISRVAVYAIPGLAGALLATLLTTALAPVRGGLPGVALGSLAGLAGGLLFSVSPGSNASVAVDYIVWQVLVFLGFHFGTQLSRSTLRRPGG